MINLDWRRHPVLRKNGRGRTRNRFRDHSSGPTLLFLSIDFRPGRHAPEQKLAVPVSGRELVPVATETEFSQDFFVPAERNQLLPGSSVPEHDRGFAEAVARCRQTSAIGREGERKYPCRVGPEFLEFVAGGQFPDLDRAFLRLRGQQAAIRGEGSRVDSAGEAQGLGLLAISEAPKPNRPPPSAPSPASGRPAKPNGQLPWRKAQGKLAVAASSACSKRRHGMEGR
jgi:hypothetical protein